MRRTRVTEGLSSRSIPSIISTSSASAASAWLSTITSALSTNSASTSHAFLSCRWALASSLAALRRWSGSLAGSCQSSRNRRASSTVSSRHLRLSLVMASATRDGRPSSWASTRTLSMRSRGWGVSVVYVITLNAPLPFGTATRPASTSDVITVAFLSSPSKHRATAALPSA